jgi:carboxyl-terminal processing protease
MRRLLLPFAALLSACSLLVSPSTTVPDDVDTAPADAATSTTAPPTATSLPPEVTVETDTLETVGCDEADENFIILCEVVDTIRQNYVDVVPLEVLAEAAIEGIESFAVFDLNTDPLECALPDAAFAPVCEALDEADAVPLDGVEAAINGMIAFALDPNSAYLDPEALALAEEDQTGSVDGIGALVNTEDRTTEDPAANPCLLISDTCRMVIISTFADSPAQRAGLMPGDELEVVDGESVLGKSLDEVTNLVRGPSGSDVELTFLRGDERFTVTITRAAIEIPIADWEVIDDVGYLQLNLFTNNSDEVVHEALRELVDDGARSLIFDLRNNPGGSLDSSVEIASEFLSDGLVLLTEAPGTEIPYEVRGGCVLTDPSFPVTILVNRGSASASEVVSGALKEAGRAILIGEHTFGKNTVQQRFSLSNGGAIKVTIARWVTPDGTDFGEDGISPDIEAEVPRDLTPEEIVAFVNTLTG